MHLMSWSPQSETCNFERIMHHFVRPLNCALQGRGRLVRRLMKGDGRQADLLRNDALNFTY
jgi:hypothetical protein